MARRIAAAFALGVLLAACGSPPTYSPRQAQIDLGSFVHIFNGASYKYDECIVSYLFHTHSPEQVKSEIQGADFGNSSTASPVLLAAKTACENLLPETGGCKDASPTATTSPEGAKSTSLETTGGTTYLNLHSARQQILEGHDDQTLVLPNPASINLGDQFVVTNHSSGVVTVKATDYTKVLKLVGTASGGSTLTVTCEYATLPAWTAGSGS